MLLIITRQKKVISVASNNKTHFDLWFFGLNQGSKNVDNYKKKRFKNFIIIYSFNTTDNDRIKDTYTKHLQGKN